MEQREHPTSEKWGLLHGEKSYVTHINKASRRPLADSTKRPVTLKLWHISHFYYS